MSTLNNFLSYNYLKSISSDNTDTLSYPVIIQKQNIYNPKNDSILLSVNPMNPNIINTQYYKDLNKDKTVQKTLTKYYYYKILDKWIYDELLPLLSFVDTSSETPKLIKSMSDFDITKLSKDSKDDIEKKIKYMENNIITKDIVRHILKKICNENKINYYYLNKNEKNIKKVFYNYLVDKLKKAITKYGKK